MWPHTQPVTAPNAPVSEETRNRTAPSRPHCGCMLIVWSTCRARLGVGASSGGAGGVVLRRTDPMVASSWWCSSTTASWAAASRRSRNRPGSAARRARGPCWTTRPDSRTATCSARSVVESRWATRMPVRPEISRSAARTTRASVTGSMRAVASSRTTTLTSRTRSRANATSCSSPADRLVPPGPRTVSRPSGSPATHSVRPSSATAASTTVRGTSSKRVMLSARVPARTSVRWVTTPTAERSCCRSRSRTSTPPRNTMPRGGSTARESREARVDLPDPVRPTRAQVWPAVSRRSTSRRANVPVP